MIIVIAVLAIVLVLVSAVLAFNVYLNVLRERFREPVLAPEVHNVVTEDGCVNLSAGIPREADAVEAWVRKLRG